MTDQSERERESREEAGDKFHDRRDEERIERERIAERVHDDFVEDEKPEESD